LPFGFILLSMIKNKKKQSPQNAMRFGAQKIFWIFMRMQLSFIFSNY
jgi:hypothetical protein